MDYPVVWRVLLDAQGGSHRERQTDALYIHVGICNYFFINTFIHLLINMHRHGGV